MADNHRSFHGMFPGEMPWNCQSQHEPTWDLRFHKLKHRQKHSPDLDSFYSTTVPVHFSGHNTISCGRLTKADTYIYFLIVFWGLTASVFCLWPKYSTDTITEVSQKHRVALTAKITSEKNHDDLFCYTPVVNRKRASTEADWGGSLSKRQEPHIKPISMMWPIIKGGFVYHEFFQ